MFLRGVLTTKHIDVVRVVKIVKARPPYQKYCYDESGAGEWSSRSSPWLQVKHDKDAPGRERMIIARARDFPGTGEWWHQQWWGEGSLDQGILLRS